MLADKESMSCSLPLYFLETHLISIALILLTLLPTSSFAESYFISGNKVDIVKSTLSGVQLISSKCLKSSSNQPCQARHAIWHLKNFYFGRMPAQDTRNPGVQICDKVLGANTVMGSNIDGNQKSFCQFKDGSLIDTYSLLQFAYKNSRIKN